MDLNIGIINSFQTSPLQTVFFLVAIILAITVHEFAHAFVASRQGDQTARLLGRVTLNPLAHLDPAGSLLFLLAGIGYGKPVPVNPYNLRDGKLGDFYVSIAGIVTNLVVAFIFAIPFQIIAAIGGDISTTTLLAANNYWLLFCQSMVAVNVLLAAFNLLPLPPLDGSKAVGILVPRRLEPAYQRYLEVGPVLLLAVLLLPFILPQFNILGKLIDPLRALFGFLVFFPTSLR